MVTYLVDAFSGPGAPFMYAIVAVGALAMAIALERTWWLGLKWRPDLPQVLASVDAGQDDQARAAAGDGPLGAVVRAGLAEEDPELAWEAMGAAAVESEAALRARVSHLAAVGNIAVMLGLLGTVYGLIIAFTALGDTSAGARAVRLSEGISTAMSTTAAGLLTGIFALAAHALLDARVRAHLTGLETVAGRIALRARRRSKG